MQQLSPSERQGDVSWSGYLIATRGPHLGFVIAAEPCFMCVMGTLRIIIVLRVVRKKRRLKVFEHRSKEVKRMKERYPVGTRVELDFMDDVQAPPVGTRGEVDWVDDVGTVHVKWDNGSYLGLISGTDRFHVVKE